MSVIQNIRDKYARLTVVIIALALLGFIAMDAFSSGNSLFGGGPSNTVGKINGEPIKVNEFKAKVAIAEDNMKQQGFPAGEGLTYQALNTVWESEVNRLLQEQEMEKLGLVLTKKERDDLIYGPNPSPIAKQYLTSPEGVYDPQQIRQMIRQIEKSNQVDQIDQLEKLLEYIEQTRISEKFGSLFSNTVNFPKWFIEKQNADGSQIASVSFIMFPYTEIPDSAAKVSDKEIQDYISKHKDDFEQEETRSINYVLFNANPSAEDSASVRTALEALKPQMLSTPDMSMFLASEGEMNFYDSYIGGNRIQVPMKDSILRTPVGGIFGPYLDADNYVIARMMGVKQWPDSVTVRHILISTTQRDPQTGQEQMVRDTATAFKLADSLRSAIAAGANFDSLVVQFSDDGGSKEKGGVYEKVPTGQMVETFNDYIFENPVGSKGIVKTQFGYHYIEIMSQKGSSPAYKIAYLRRPIIVSSSTDQQARNTANRFANVATDEKSFNDEYEKQLKPLGMSKGIAQDIDEFAFSVQGVGLSRNFVRKVFDAKRGEVIEPEKIGNFYVVAVITEVNEKGTQSVAKARMSVEPLLRNKKKAEIIRQRLGKVSTLEAIATASNKQIQTADSVRMVGTQPLGFPAIESRLIGAAFNPANRGKVVAEPLAGNSGVYVMRVNNVSATPLGGVNIDEQRNNYYQQAKMRSDAIASAMEALKEVSSIKDNRLKHYQ